MGCSEVARREQSGTRLGRSQAPKYGKAWRHVPATTIMMAFLRADYVLYAIVLAFPIAALFNHLTDKDTEPERSSAPEKESNDSSNQEKKSAPTIMQPERPDLPPPKDDPFTQEELRAFDGSDPNKPIYVAIKGAPRWLALH